MDSIEAAPSVPPFIPAQEDYFYRSAKEEGFRARSAYKLLHVDEITHVFAGVTRAVDLCAAPGSWSQLLSRELAKNAEAGAGSTRVVAVDLQEMAPIPGVVSVRGDITRADTADTVVSLLGGELAQLVVCDGAPDVTGLHQVDEFLQSQLLFAALAISCRLLAKGGAFVSKLFKGDCLDLTQAQMRLLFDTVEVIKPSSSRIRSAEHFIVGKGFRWTQAELPSLLGGDDDGEEEEECGALAALKRVLALGDLDAADKAAAAE